MSEYIYASNGEPLANGCGEIALARHEIVRCRDCKHFTPKGTHKFENGKVNADFCTYVRSWMLQITPDGFCAWGVRGKP